MSFKVIHSCETCDNNVTKVEHVDLNSIVLVARGDDLFIHDVIDSDDSRVEPLMLSAHQSVVLVCNSTVLGVPD
jgi:hypothetical protein